LLPRFEENSQQIWQDATDFSIKCASFFENVSKISKNIRKMSKNARFLSKNE
jgi:cytochrome c556